MADSPVQFLHALSSGTIKNPTRWVALVWWYHVHNRSTEATARQVAKDMELAGYGKQNTSRVSDALKDNRKLTRGAKRKLRNPYHGED